MENISTVQSELKGFPNRLSSENILNNDIELKLRQLLQQNLTFKGEKTSFPPHNLHAFAAKFPPQMPRLFVQELTDCGETVLDPMAGSGTTLVEALLAGRNAIGIDLDPLSVLVCQVKSTPLDWLQCAEIGAEVLLAARQGLHLVSEEKVGRFYSIQTEEFFDYWFERHTIRELHALVQAIATVNLSDIRAFLQVVFSSIIITKSGGVTRARDLAHSRPHRDLNKQVTSSAFDVFEERLHSAIESLSHIAFKGEATVKCADARELPLADNSVDLIVTSPPYAANAIDYMRSHKFSLIWLGYEPKELTKLRRQYIGSEVRSLCLKISSETGDRVVNTIQKIAKVTSPGGGSLLWRYGNRPG